ncbi:MAG: hypothetical protein AAGI91_08480 [Bacteroidota bacterium]
MVELRDEVRGRDIVEAAQGLLQDARWDRQFDVIWDGRLIRSLILEPEDLMAMVNAKAAASSGVEVTIAVRPLDREMAKLCALLLRGRGRVARVVSTLEEALAARRAGVLVDS